MDDVEVDQQADGQPRQLEVRKNLGGIDGVNFFDCLNLDEYAAFDKVIHTKARVQGDAMVRDPQAHLMLEGEAQDAKLGIEANVVDSHQVSILCVLSALRGYSIGTQAIGPAR